MNQKEINENCWLAHAVIAEDGDLLNDVFRDKTKARDWCNCLCLRYNERYNVVPVKIFKAETIDTLLEDK